MKTVKNAIVCAAAVGLLVSQAAPAFAASPAGRAGAAVGASESLGFPDGAAPVIAIISLLAVVALIAVISDSDDDSPVSP